jgi:hypothetical protein
VHLEFLTSHGWLVQTVLIVLGLIVTGLAGLVLHQCLQLRGRLRGLLAGDGVPALDELLSAHAERLAGLEVDTAGLRLQLERAMAQMTGHTQHVAVVRFNAFSDTGSDLSFSLALLDGEGSGVVVTSLFGREESRIYAKPIVARSSQYRLSAEEELAIARAIQPETDRSGGRISRA